MHDNENKVTEECIGPKEIVFIGVPSAALPWIFLLLALRIPYFHGIARAMVPGVVRNLFSDIANYGLWALSIWLCFAGPVAIMSGKRSRYILAMICSTLCCIGVVGSRDSRKNSDNLMSELQKRPTTDELRKLIPKPKGPIAAKDLRLMINDQWVQNGRAIPLQILAGKPGINLWVRNETGPSLELATFILSISNCNIDSLDPASSSWIRGSFPTGQPNPTSLINDHWKSTPINPQSRVGFPSVFVNCGDKKSAIGYVGISAKDAEFIQIPFKLITAP